MLNFYFKFVVEIVKICLFVLYFVGLFYFLGFIVNFSQEFDVYFKYIQVKIDQNVDELNVLLQIVVLVLSLYVFFGIKLRYQSF